MVDSILNKGYLRVNDLFSNAQYTSIQDDVAREVKEETCGIVPFCKTSAGKQASQWSGLWNKVFGAEGDESIK